MGTQWYANFTNYTNVGYRYKWNKIINGTGGGDAGHNKPPNDYVLNSNGVYPQLYDLLNDPYEYVNLTKNNSELVESLIQQMYEMEKNGVPQLDNDTTCPSYKCRIDHNFSVGPIWAPYCE